jgi:hypothetical protein
MGRYPASYATATDGGSIQLPWVSYRLSATGIGFLDILSRQGIPPLLRSAYRTDGPDPTGFPRSAHSIHDRIGCPLCPETTRCSSGRSCPPDRRAPPLPGARSCHPGEASHLPELRMTRRRQGFTRVHPPGLLPGPPVPGWNSDHLGHRPRASHPAGQEPATHAEAGDGQLSTRPSYAIDTVDLLPMQLNRYVRPRVARHSFSCSRRTFRWIPSTHR